ncbi:MAG TPA: (Fe-S)-binding protein [Actinomycetota bacterium]|nr:(Fe-S)-binding protein [Actinomycetota bacterium]
MTCLVDLLSPEVAESTAALLADLNVRVDVPDAQTCCGQPAFNAGYPSVARRTARTLLEAFDRSTTVVAPSGSCAAMIRLHLPRLFEGTREADRARELASKTFELSEFLVDVLGVERIAGVFPSTVAYHDSCHGLRGLRLGDQGRRLLTGIEGLRLVEMERSDTCCGFGGTFSIRLPELATAMADDELARARAVGADVLVGGDTGCLMHLAGRAARTGGPRPMHLALLLAEARGLRASPAP